MTKRVVVCVILLLLSTALPIRAKSQARISELGNYLGYSPLAYTEWARSSQYITVRDGTRLAVDIFRPARDGQPVVDPLPVIWTQHRYHRADAPGGKLTTVLDQSPWLKSVLQYGYVIAAVDTRGSGASFGTRSSELPAEEALDAYDITEWLATQPWCDGNVGMYGRSYLGVTQLMAASTQPPHLKAIFPEMSSSDPYAMVYPGGIFRIDLAMGWGNMIKRLDRGGSVASVDEDQDQSLLKQALAQHFANIDFLGMVSPLWYRNSHPSTSATQPYLQAGPVNHWSEIQQSGVPIYHLAGWFDPFVREALLAFRTLTNPQKIVIGPWSHTDSSELDLAAEHLRWYDYWLKGIDNGIMNEPAVAYYTMGAAPGQEWHTTTTWPLANEQPTRFYLQSGPSGSIDSHNDGLLSPQPVTDTAGQDDYTVDYGATSGRTTRWSNTYGGTFGYRDMASNDKKGLTYTTPPLTEDMELTGHPILHLWLSSSTTDADVFAYLEQVDADGLSNYVTEGALRASLRATSTPPSAYLDLPYHRFYREDVAELTPGQPVELVFDLLPTSILVHAGERVRLTITSADSGNANTPVRSPAPVISVYRNTQHASYLVLPVIGPPAAPPTPTAAPLPTAAPVAAATLQPSPTPAVRSSTQSTLLYALGLLLVVVLAVLLALLWRRSRS